MTADTAGPMEQYVRDQVYGDDHSKAALYEKAREQDAAMKAAEAARDEALEALRAMQMLFDEIAEWQEAASPLGVLGKRVVNRALRLKGTADAILNRTSETGAKP